MSGSLKSLDKKIAKRRQVYKPVLDNPFTNEAHMWPRVHDQPLIWQLLQSSIINKLVHIQSKESYPWELYTDFNEIVQYLSGAHGNSDPVCLFVCNKDPDVPLVLLQQIPLLCYMAPMTVKLVQLPKSAMDTFKSVSKYGMLLLRCDDRVDKKFVSQIQKNVDLLQFPWLNAIKYRPTSVKLLKTTVPIVSKKRQK
ncbi:HN1_G0009840.mRNA.1.CDS.1 [Saccharomyces cerevisiae]|nr:HN1_G0009840.mRNA.1.CDS.1 [Saccharomyces cerevisiae]CAI4690289.1 BAL_1a_G0043640.mRNA.1.CDS.1 [Saccharomyces cerevisiae]CAI7292002.1 BAL_1a_G0043640.mRNA.1.CDS.1 [Saccharomyces cerevisiae]